MPSRRSTKGEVGKENGMDAAQDVDMQDALKPAGKREAPEKAAKQPKKPRQSDTANAEALDEKTTTTNIKDGARAARKASQNLQLKEKTTRVSSKSDKVEYKEQAKAETEGAALTATADATATSSSSRRLGDFVVTDENGVSEPLESVQYTTKPLFISGVIYPLNGPTTKESGQRVDRFGPLTSFSIDCSSKAGAGIILSTATATYTCIRPAAAYKKVFAHLAEQTDITFEVYKALAVAHGGNKEASFEEVVARIARAKVAKSYHTAKEGLLVNGKFVLAQLEKIDSTFTSTQFASTLSDLLKDFKYIGGAQKQHQTKGGIVISRGEGSGGSGSGSSDKEDSANDAQMEADEEFARQLQAKMDAETRQQQQRPAGTGNKSSKSSAAAYIKVSETEIADDYPGPTPYLKEDGEEADELLLYDEELAGLDPELLPRRLLKDFSIYNSDGLMTTLELLPMQAGVDPDVEMFASGIVLDDDGDFSGGQKLEADNNGAGGSGSGGSGAGGSSSGAAAMETDTPKDTGMRMMLSSIKEWVIEFGADMVFITIRTDVAWYRLEQPAQRYAPWFNVILKCARVAAKVMTDLTQESRPSKVSFDDVKKMLAALPAFTDSESTVANPLYISKKVDLVERFLCVHGQIILNCFKNYPVKAVQRSAFVNALKEKLQQLRHSKLYQTAAKPNVKSRAVNRNPMRDRAAGARSKPMTATATTMVKSVWQAYFAVAAAADGADAATAANNDGTAAAGVEGAAAAAAVEVEDDLNEEENDEDVQENALAEASPARPQKKKVVKKKKAAKPTWVGAAIATEHGDKLYNSVKVAGMEITVGDVIEILPEDDNEDEEEQETDEEVEAALELGIVQAMWQTSSGGKFVQIRELVPGSETVLGDAASDWELFLTTHVSTHLLSAVTEKTNARRLQRTWDAQLRLAHFKQDEELRNKNAAAVDAGEKPELFWRMEYRPQEGMFCDPPADLHLGKRLPEEDSDTEEEVEAIPQALANNAGFKKEGVEYRIGDFVFLHPDVFEPLPEGTIEINLPDYLSNSRYHKGSTEGLKAYGIGRVVGITTVSTKDKKEAGGKGAKKTRGEASGSGTTSGTAGRVSEVTVQRYWRPEDISRERAYKAGSYYDVFAGDEEMKVDVEDVVKKIRVVPSGYPNDVETFTCVGSFSLTQQAKSTTKGKGKAAKAAVADKDLKPGVDYHKSSNGNVYEFGAAPTDLVIPTDLTKYSTASGSTAAAKGKGKAAAVATTTDVEMIDAVDKGKGKATTATAAAASEMFTGDAISLATMDIFAGCGGLSEGMHQAKAAHTKWAIEYEQPAAEAFKLNNPDAAVFANNCNVLLYAAMAKAGLIEDCLASVEAAEESAKLPEEQRAQLPAPGEVDFICGGPPCQGYSGMNRFNKGNWSMVQNSMVMSFLSYCDFYRPRYFLLENVRNFVSHNKSFTFRLTLRSLLEMGYQVRFGVLNAGNFGVSQSRKRTFIWAAAPGELLPDWPALMHAFRTPQLTINMPGGVQYTAVPQTEGAPLRPVTVKDAIHDLPVIENGADTEEMPYSGPPNSAFQRAIRGSNTTLFDHISKQMNELNLARCRIIPKNAPGADWRALQEHIAAHPEDTNVKSADGRSELGPLVPWCLPNTADRHNQWRGLFGRLDWEGHFPTSTTDPQPMGKVGQVFHPEQDRIVSVRECARAQGFPDRFRFYGNVHHKHKQVGNAVPPPLAAALGRELRKKLEKHAEDVAKAQLAAQLGL